MNRIDIINDLLGGKGSYLEIGVRNPADCFNQIRADVKIGVDPAVDAPSVYQMTSDEFFAVSWRTFDVIFVDGLHTEAQCMRDIIHALDALKPGGYVVVHDIWPKSRMAAAPIKPEGGGPWNGEVYKAWCEVLRWDHVQTTSMDCDQGVGILWWGKRATLDDMVPPAHVSYEMFKKNVFRWYG